MAAALDHARERGHEHLSVDFSSTNPLSRPFWLGLGFVPTGERIRQIIRLACRCVPGRGRPAVI